MSESKEVLGSVGRKSVLPPTDGDVVVAPTTAQTDGALAARLAKAEADREEARAELEIISDLRWQSDMRAIRRWRDANPGNDLVLPDHGDLCAWLLAELACAEVGRRQLTRDELRDVAMQHGHFIIPARAGIVFTWTDKETGEVLGRGELARGNVQPLRTSRTSGTPTPPSDGEGGAQRSEAEPNEHKASTPDPDKATPSPAVEAEELAARLKHHGTCGALHDTREGVDFRLAADLLTRLASEKARLEGEVWDAAKAMSDINREAVTFSDRAERAEAERDAATKQANENDERANTYAARADELGQQLFAERKRAEAAETALKELHAMVWGEAPHLLDEDRAGNARLDLEIEAILNRPHGLTGEGAER